MPMSAANVIDLEAYCRARVEQSYQASLPKLVSYTMQPVMMWLPYWGYVPVMMMGAVDHGVA